MTGYLERTIECPTGPIGDFDALAGQVEAPLRSMGMTAMMIIHGAGEEYDSAVEDFTHTGPRGDADTPAGAGSVTLDLLRYVSAAHHHPLFDKHDEPNLDTGDVRTTLFHMPQERSEAAEYTEILKVTHHLQPVKAIAVQYLQERDSSGLLLEPTAVHCAARISHDPFADLKTVFTTVSIDDGRDVAYTLANPTTKRLTVTSGHERSLSIQRAEIPPSFHHGRIWTQLLQNILAR